MTPPCGQVGVPPRRVDEVDRGRLDLQRRGRSTLPPHVVGEIHVCRNGERHAEVDRFGEPVLEILDSREVAELAAHEPAPLVRANELAAEAELLSERHRLLRPLEPQLGRPAAESLE